jgi:hypothetical protein
VVFGSVAPERCTGEDGSPGHPLCFPVQRGTGAQITVDGVARFKMPHRELAIA